MHGRLVAGALLVIVLTAATITWAPSSIHSPLGGWSSLSAEAKSRIRNLRERWRGKKMPEAFPVSNDCR